MADVATKAGLGTMPGAGSIIIGFDFGTTYSGVVFAESDEPDELFEVSEWPESRTDNNRFLSSRKVPTRIRYLANGQFEWGAQVPEEAAHEAHRLFKLALEPGMFRKAAENIGEIPLPANVDQIITDYMTGVWGRVLQTMREQLEYEPENFHVVLTVPAVWSELSKQRTVQAFRRIPNLPKSVTTYLLSEPEAAAIAVIKETDRSSLKVDDTFVVVDAGGGTVDLITYTITSLHPILKVHEATVGTGELSGSSLINLRFQQFLTAKLQNEPHWSTGIAHAALQRFENTVKKRFSTADLAENEIYNIPVPGLALNIGAGIKKTGVFSLEAAEVHMVYERSILMIIQLVKEQIAMCDRPVRSIFLVGGFGSSTYLRERIESAVLDDTSIKGPIEILQPENAWTAVVRGAAMNGIAQSKPANYDIPVVVSRTARRHYGYEIGVHYNDIVHASLASKKYWNGLDGTFDVKAMIWFIRRGDNVYEDHPFSKSYYYYWPVGVERSRKYPLSIYADETSKKAPIERSASVKLLCRLTADLSAIPDDRLDKRLGADGRMHYYVEFDIEATYHSASTQYTVIHKGKRYDTVNAEYV
ncbi:hypothetical protein E0Z10_g5648 [Xylaria hypoxylon]|uniref:Uncharacterized protein n=1 Tax=Xylaria hypoxylon TaxID=37992 RepID=A0A4Z0YVD9_9PEZI|nr:hypothetical protein E0Z10_g5648 [Xylaria hypoxylon]